MRLFGFEFKKADNAVQERVSKNSSVLLETFLSGMDDKDIRVTKGTFYEIYKRNGDVRACIRKIAQRSGVNGMYVDRKGKISPFPGASAFDMPTFYDFRLRLIRDLKIAGEAYIVPVYDGLLEVVSFKFLDPRSMYKVLDDAGNIVAFKQIVRGRYVVIPADGVSYFKLEPHTSNEHDGLSILEGVIYDTLSDKEAMIRNYKFFINGMNTDILLMLDKEINADQLEIAKEKLKEQIVGNGRAHEPLISNGVKDVKHLSLTPKDIEFISQRRLTTEKVCATLDVPKSLIGYVEDVNLANGKEQTAHFIENTIRPMEAFIEYVITSLWKTYADPSFGEDGSALKLDGESSEDRTAIETGQREDVTLGIISIDEARQERGFKPW